VGESVTEVEIGRWLKNEGDAVDKDEPVVEIETDKITLELPAPAAGRISRIDKKQGDAATVGDVIGLLEEGVGGAPSAEPSARKSEPAPAETSSDGAEPRIMPAARHLAEQHGIDPTKVEGTGPGGRVLKEDVQRAVDSADKRGAKS